MSRSSPRRQTPQGAASREKILSTAVDLFAEQGFSATSIDQLCRRAGIVKTAIYWHFGSKEGLLSAALDQVAMDWIAGIERSVEGATNPIESLDRAVAGLRGIVEKRPELLRLLLSMTYERASVSPETRDVVLRVMESAEAAIVAGIERAVGFPVPRSDLAAHLMLSLLQGALMRRVLHPERDLDPIFEDMRDVVGRVLNARIREVQPEAEAWRSR